MNFSPSMGSIASAVAPGAIGCSIMTVDRGAAGFTAEPDLARLVTHIACKQVAQPNPLSPKPGDMANTIQWTIAIYEAKVTVFFARTKTYIESNFLKSRA